MLTATLVHENLGGFAGVAHCYRLEQPLEGHEYVTIWVQPKLALPVPMGRNRPPGQITQPSEAVIVGAHPTGAAVKMNRLPGSYVHPDATHAGALWLNGYEIEVSE